MSVQATAWVFERSKHGGSSLLVLLSIANNADSEGYARHLAQSLIASECRMSERAIRYITRKLEASGELVTRRFINGDSVSSQAKHAYEIPGVIRDGFHLRGRPSTPGGQPARFAGSNRQGLPVGNRQNRGEQPERAIAGDKEPKFTKTLNTTPPTPPAAAGGNETPVPVRPPNRFVVDCQQGAQVEVLVPIGRKLFRNNAEWQAYDSRTGDQVRGRHAEAVEQFFKLKGFQVKILKRAIDIAKAPA